MNPEIKAKWVEALTSGEFAQGKGALKTPEGHCCLGVLCELFLKEHPDHQWFHRPAENNYEFLGVTGSLPKAVQIWAGLPAGFGGELVVPTDMGNGTYEPRPKTLPFLNDHGMIFEAIAKGIKEQL